MYERRLEIIENKLKKQGVRDVKFFFGDIGEKPFSHIVKDVCIFLEHILEGKTKPLVLNDKNIIK